MQFPLPFPVHLDTVLIFAFPGPVRDWVIVVVARPEQNGIVQLNIQIWLAPSAMNLFYLLSRVYIDT